MDAGIEQYATDFTTKESPCLAKLNRETYLKVIQPVMLSGHLQGAFLSMVSYMVKPTRILEIGTFTGYSAICLAQGLQDGGQLHTIDMEEELEDMCRAYFKEAGLEDKITLHLGDAIQILPSIEGEFDLVFIDADKPNYETYFDMVIDRVKTGGIILADNVLYEGDVLLPPEKQSKNARSIAAFNEKVRRDPRIEHVLLPIRDGLMMIRKK